MLPWCPLARRRADADIHWQRPWSPTSKTARRAVTMIMITGGMGFIGLHTARKFLDAGEDVVITYYRTWREPDFLKDEYGKRVQIESIDTTSHHDVLGCAVKHKV